MGVLHPRGGCDTHRRTEVDFRGVIAANFLFADHPDAIAEVRLQFHSPIRVLCLFADSLALVLPAKL